MTSEAVYEKLAKYLDQGVIGSPKSPSLMGILKILFPGDEAELALQLPLTNQTLSELQEAIPEKADELETILARMAKRGTVFTSQKPGGERKYRLLPSIVGWAETPFWGGKQTEDTKKLAPLWLKYREEAFAQELVRGDMPVMRVVPISKNLQDSSEVLPFDAIRPKVQVQSYCAVANCPCRQMKTAVGEGCEHTRENCLHFGSMARYMVEQDMAREISKSEVFDIMKKSNEEGLVHIVDNMEGHMSTICNCCGCCCAFLTSKKAMGLNTISTSSYVARVDADSCSACGTCEERCPMDAIAIGDADVAVVDETRCIGCGVCTPTCPTEAVELVERAKVVPPPDIATFLQARFKTAE